MAKPTDLFTVTIKFLNKDGTENSKKAPFVRSLALIGDEVRLTAEHIWHEAGSPKPCVVEVVQVITDYNVNGKGEWEDLG